MHEDSNEIDTLPYSETEDDCYEDDEVTSTSHSPSMMNGHQSEIHDEGMNEVATSLLYAKRIKVSHKKYVIPPLAGSMCSSKPIRSSEYEDDAESRYTGLDAAELDATTCLYGNKRQRKEKIHGVVNIVRSIIPGGSRSDPVTILDEAVLYLRSLQLRAGFLGLCNFDVAF